MKYNKIVINAIHFSKRTQLTGIQRVVKELVIRLDKLCEVLDGVTIEYAYPEGAKNELLDLSLLKHIKSLILPNKSSKILHAITLPRYLKKENAQALSIEIDNGFITKNKVSYIHDIRSAELKSDPFMFRLKAKIYFMIEKRLARRVITVSNYQKSRMIKVLKYNADKINVIYPGWEHMNEIEPDNDIFQKFKNINKGEYFYALGSLAPHKNFKWIIEVAKRNPDKVFVIAGGKNLKTWKNNIETNKIENVIFPGYVSDGESKALMQNCKAFLFPSKYEGFGIPPLEALACGAPIIISKATCLPEIYEDCAHYFDPDDYEVDLDKLIEEDVASPEKILKKCSWDEAAKKVINVLLEE